MHLGRASVGLADRFRDRPFDVGEILFPFDFQQRQGDNTHQYCNYFARPVLVWEAPLCPLHSSF